ncbi:hypothetical protein OB920_08615 [Halobacteria archaeon HArc-gm2]|nr:hypothetical protein [Halobacteria archaeon HArc-gm2]
MSHNDQAADAGRATGGVDGQPSTDSPAGPGEADVAGTDADAARGHPKPNRLVLEARSERAIVRVEVGGEIGSDCLLGDSEPSYDDVAICRLDGEGEREGYRFSGPMVDLEVVEGEVAVELDFRRDGPGEREGPTRLSVHAQGPAVDYELAVSGAVESISGGTPADPDGNLVDAVTGRVTGSSVDEYLFSGEVTAFETATDDVVVLLDGQVVDPADLG